MSTGIPGLRAMLWDDIAFSYGMHDLKSGETGVYYNKISPFDLDYALMENLEPVIGLWIEHLRIVAELNTPTVLFHFRPAHVAVIMGHDDALLRLIKARVYLDVRDFRGMTPLHYAALFGRAKQIKMLLDAGASTNIECATGGTYFDIQRCLEPQKFPYFFPLNLLDEKGKRLTPRDFTDLTNATYLIDNKLTPAQMLYEIFNSNPTQQEFPFSFEYARRYRNMKQQRPLFYFAQVTKDSSGHTLPFSPGLGLFATQPIKKGDMIGEFMGVLTDNCVPMDFTLCNSDGKGLDATVFRNEMFHLNDGFPNTVTISLNCVAGCESRNIIIASEDIKEGAQICINYGLILDLKYNRPYLQFRSHEALEFFKHHSLSYLIEVFTKVASSKECTLEEYFLSEKLRYIVQTPPVLFYIALQFSLDDLLILYDFLKIVYPQTNEDNVKSIFLTCRSIQGCILSEKALEMNIPTLAPTFRAWIETVPSVSSQAVGHHILLLSNKLILDLINEKLPEKEAIERWREFEHKHRTVAKESLTKFFKLSE